MTIKTKQENEIMTVAETAKLLRVSLPLAYQLCRDGTLKAGRVGKHWRVHRSQVLKLCGKTEV